MAATQSLKGRRSLSDLNEVEENIILNEEVKSNEM